ncbi:ABC transporter permease [Aidingimonas halophila]|uniref:NitT/TauT family transport system permease protein n=1 Tax=Aidingimonas halophila TaxID=574349 RepID=A0A1H2X383_9GAMM|nr:ABC transporter permease [Aidingimonas halophila]GHC28030.1 ABC transporter permease [Aidingimonas halophila]SDW87196.1 NitT/TauT family transport system permease protein [Aidingimonas halophila]
MAVGRDDHAFRQRWFEFLAPISRKWRIILGTSIWILFFGLWELAVLSGWVNTLLVPSPLQVINTLYELFAERGFLMDVGISVARILGSFVVACAIAIPLGVLMGSFKAVESFVNPFVSAWRYLPAPAFIPILLMWFGTGELPKLALLFLGVIFFLITLIMDHTSQVRSELIETAMTLGGQRWQILWTVVVPAVLPSIVTSMRQMLAIAWTYLVIAEIIASTTGIGAMMMRARRFLNTDEIMAGILIIGLLGLAFDVMFRWLQRVLFPYLDQEGHA